MRLAAVLILATALAACGDVATAERLSAKESLDGIDVPTIGTVGDFPDPARRHVVNVTADGRIVIDGKTIATKSLADELRVCAARSLVPATDVPSRDVSDETIVLRVDGRLRWGAVAAVVSACWDAGVWRVELAARHESDGVEGALRLHLAAEVRSVVQLPGDGTRPSIPIRIVAGADGTSPASFRAVVPLWKRDSTWPDSPHTPWEVNIDSGVSTGAVIAYLAALACERESVHWLETTYYEPEVRSRMLLFDREVGQSSCRDDVVEVWTRTRRAPASDAPSPAVPRRIGERVGFVGVKLGESWKSPTPK